MTRQEKRERAINICEEALEFEAGPEQEGFVERRCGGDPELVGYVREYILAAQERSSYDRRSDRFSGKRIGGYRLDEELGRGSMGIVYRGFDSAIGRTVAVKVIRLQPTSTAEEDAEMRLRFTREAGAAGKLAHPNIVVIYQLGEETGVPYMAMEFVSGVSLEQALTPGTPMDAQTALSIISQVADALDFAHAEGIVHRDIKPANIMVRPDGRIKITDFGIARIVSQTMTKIGNSMGTPSYMAPEQILASKVDGKADQFSLAVMAYQMLSGRKPFAADTSHALYYQIMNVDPPALSEVNALLPPSCASVVQRSLSKVADQRYPNCSAFVQALRQSFIEHEPQPKIVKTEQPLALEEPPRPHRSPRPRRRIIVMSAGVVACAVLILVGVFRYRSRIPSFQAAPNKTTTEVTPRIPQGKKEGGQPLLSAAQPQAQEEQKATKASAQRLNGSDSQEVIALSKLTFSKSNLISLPEWSESIDLNEVRQAMFQSIRAFRASRNLAKDSRFQYNPIAENSANMHTYEIMNTATELGQFSPGGEPPYVRYSLAGGSGYVDELYGKFVINLNGGTTLDLPAACMEFSHLEKPTSANIQGIVLRLAQAFECKTHESTVGASVLTEGTSVGISVGVMAGGLRENANGGTNSVITLVVVEDVVRDKLEHVNAFPVTASLRTTKSVSFSADVPAGFTFTGANWEYERDYPISAAGASGRNTDHPLIKQDIFDKAERAKLLAAGGYLLPGQVFSAEVRGSHISMPLKFFEGAGIYTLVVFVAPVPSGWALKVTARSIIVRQ